MTDAIIHLDLNNSSSPHQSLAAENEMETGKPPSPSATASTAEVKTDEATAALATAPVAPAMPAIQYPGKWLYSTLCFGLLLAMFLVALDMVGNHP